jgi:hypothetical protein
VSPGFTAILQVIFVFHSIPQRLAKSEAKKKVKNEDSS